MASIYDITGRALELCEMANDGELEEEVFIDTLESIEGEFDDKVECYCKALKNIEGDIEAVDAEIKRLQAKKKAMENNVKRMKSVMYKSMKILGKTTAGGNILRASIQKNGGKLPLILADIKPELLPAEFRITEYRADGDAIREALDAGRELDFAKYGERGESLRIK
jgi:hypothetical protein